MASIGSSLGGDNFANDQQKKQYYSFQLYYNRPMDIGISARTTYTNGNNGKKYPRTSVFAYVQFNEKDALGNTKRNSISLSPEDWYRWLITVSELLKKSQQIYGENHISDTVTEDDFKIVNFKGEVLQMVPVMAKVENNNIPAVRIIINEPSVFADFPLIDIKSMYNVLSKVDIWTCGMTACILGDSL